MRVDELMSSPVVTVTPEMSVKAAAAVLVDGNVTAAPVLSDAGALLGIVSGADLLRHGTPHDPRTYIRPLPDDPTSPPDAVRDVMTADVITVAERADAADAIATMVNHRVKSVPVLRDGRVVGIVSQRDLLRALARPDEAIRDDVAARLKENVNPSGHIRVTVEDGVVALHGPSAERGAGTAALVRTVPGVIRVVWPDEV